MVTMNNINIINFLPRLSIIATLLFFLFFEKIKLIINIYDNGDLDKRKIHLGNIPPIGGIIFYFILIVVFNLFNIKSCYFLFHKMS